MSKKIKWITGLLVSVALSTGLTFSSFAGVISSISIKVDHELEAGEYLPTIDCYSDGTVSADEGEVVVSVTSSRKYEIEDAEWYSDEDDLVEAGDTPIMEVTLVVRDEYEDSYYFDDSYSTSSINVTGGTCTRVDEEDDYEIVLRIKLDAVEGQFGEPEYAEWKSNKVATAYWEAPDEGGTGKYEVKLYRGGSTVTTIETTSTSYNFYQYITRTGTYSFKVRTIAKTTSQGAYGDSSDWVESDEIYISSDEVYDGSSIGDGTVYGTEGPTGTTTSGPSSTTTSSTAGWQYSSGHWYYIYPDGSYITDGWIDIAGSWYLFNSYGQMLTGWQNIGDAIYYLRDSGDILVGWLQYNSKWYYFNPYPDEYYGMMFRNYWISVDGNIYFMTEDGTMAEGWMQIDGNWYYFYPGDGRKAISTTIDGFYVNENGMWIR